VTAGNRSGDNRSKVQCPTCTRDDFKSRMAMKIHHAKVHGESIAGVEVDCHWCGNSVRRNRSRIESAERIFCDAECRGAWRSENWSNDEFPRWNGGPVTVECHRCGETFERRRNQVDRAERSFCSRSCFGAWRSEFQRGANNPSWTGGESVRTAVRDLIGQVPWETVASNVRRDHCKMCGDAETTDDRALAVHHIIPIMAGGCNGPELLMTLCPKCHRRVEAYTRQYVEPVLVE